MRQRPLLKTLTFAVLHFATAFIVVYALTGSLVIGGAVALIEPLCNTLVFYLHERAWQRFGRQLWPRRIPEIHGARPDRQQPDRPHASLSEAHST